MNVKRLVIPKDNPLLFDYCTKCGERHKKMISVNFGFCQDCITKVGKKDRKTNETQKDLTNFKKRKFERKVSFKTLNESEAYEFEKNSLRK
jgi:hypothetical protein